MNPFVQEVLDFIPTDDTPFTIWFTKKDGTPRMMHAMRGIGKLTTDHSQGIADTEEGIDSPAAKKWQTVKKRKENNPHLLNVWDLEMNGWRSINLLTVTQVKTAESGILKVGTGP